MKYIIADDSTIMRRVIHNCLNAISPALRPEIAYEAENGIELLNRLEQLKKENHLNDVVVILDVNMPGMDGIEALKAMRKDNYYASVPVIMCTTESNPSTIVDTLKAGATNYILKPVNPELLETKIKSVRGEKSPASPQP